MLRLGSVVVGASVLTTAASETFLDGGMRTKEDNKTEVIEDNKIGDGVRNIVRIRRSATPFFT